MKRYVNDYYVTISTEGPQVVARDDQGSKRAWGGVILATGRELAEYLFHRAEIGEVSIDVNGNTRVLILVD